MSDRNRGRGRSSGRDNFPPSGRGGGLQGGPDQSSGGPHSRRGGDSHRGRRRGNSGQSRSSRGRGPPPNVFKKDVPAQIDSRLSDSESNAIIERLKSLKVSDAGHVVRPDFGEKGVTVTLRANFFAIEYPKDTVLYDYSVRIEPELKDEEKHTRKRLFELLEENPAVKEFRNETTHDNAQRLISKRPFPDNFRAVIPFYEAHQTGPGPESKEYIITLGNMQELESKDLDAYLQGENSDYDPLPIIAAFNLITTAHAVRTGVRFGRNRYYWDPDSYGEDSMPLGPGLEIWKGFYASVRPTYKSLMTSVNVAMSPFFTPYAKLSDAMNKYREATRGARFPDVFYRRLRVTTKHLGYAKKSTIFGFSDNPPSRTKFNCEEYGEISVEEYFKRKYDIALSDRDLPPVNLGSKKKANWVPVELCELGLGQPHVGVIEDTAKMIEYACKPPYENARLITEQGLNKLGLASQESPMKAFDVKVSSEMAVVPGRVLPAPAVHYQENSRIVRNGSWNIVGVKFYEGATVDNLAVLVVSDGDRRFDFQGKDDSELINVIDGFLAKCRSSGMAVKNTVQRGFVDISNMRRSPRQPALEAIENELKTLGRPSMLLVLLSNRDQHIFSGIKKLLDCKLGISNVCMLTARLRKEQGQDQYFSNIALKVNAKLGGINHQIDPSATNWLKDTMLVGMDVTHPGISCVKGTPSIAAVVASCEATFMQYPASLRLHEHRVEMIEFVKEMMIERLEEYKKRMKGSPSHVVVFRDGVSEGQFDKVLIHELPKIREAFEHFPDYKPKLTIVICGKRHHTRFYPTNMDDADDRTSNTKAGTVVDKGVTDVYNFDFYLQAHSALQGTVRPTHYTVIYDENKFQADTIQQGTHDLSFLWARATKSVSYAPPAYWADRACDRARLYLHEILPPESRSRVRSFDEDKMRRYAEEIWGSGIHENLRGSMFYL